MPFYPGLKSSYSAQPGIFLVQTAADGALVGRYWLIYPVGATGAAVLRGFRFSSQLGSALVAVTSPRIRIERVTFTGTPSGATVAACKSDSTNPASTLSVRTAATGLSLSAGDACLSFLPVASATGIGYCAPAVTVTEVGDGIILRPGEGVVCRQPDAGTAGDTRRFTLDPWWDEYLSII